MLDTPNDKKAALERLKAQFSDRNWRLDNLYYVQDETGTRVLYRRRPAQRAYCADTWLLDIIAKARQLGMSSQVGVEMLDTAVFSKNKACGIIDYKLEDAKKKLEKIKFAYDNLPAYIRQSVMMTKDNEDEIRFSNGSSITVGTSHRGGTLQFLHVSEFGKTAAEKPEVASEIVNGAFNTIAPGQRIVVESTAHGTSGRFFEMVERAKAKLAEGTPLTALDFKLHFYGWFFREDYRVQSNLVIVPQEVEDYFAELKRDHGITVDADQKAWYAQKLALLGWDDCRQEFPSHLGELFFNSMEGAFFKKELSKARAEGRIGQRVPYDPTRRVHTCWDKGMNEKSDRNAIWWFQHDGVRFRWIDYYENAGETLAHYAGVVEEKRITRKFLYGHHYGPHDLKQRVWASHSAVPQTMLDVAKEAGINFTLVPRVSDKEVSIEAARRCINNSWFDAEYCKRGVDMLDNYRKTWNKTLGQWTNVPFHDQASNAADGFQCGAMGVQPEKDDGGSRVDRFSGRPKGTQWSR